MALTYYTIDVRDSTSGGTPVTGLSPVWEFFSNLATNIALTQPVIGEIGNGQYRFTYDPVLNGDASGQIDAGSALLTPGDRYIDVALYRTDLSNPNPITWVVTARDSTTGGTSVTGLTPTFISFYYLSNQVSAPKPTINGIGYGQYAIVWNPTTQGEVAGQIDLGASLVLSKDRYVDFTFSLPAVSGAGVQITGPSSGVSGTASLTFTVTIPQYVFNPVTVSLTDNGVGGIFSTSVVTLASGFSPSATFTYTPQSGGVVLLSASTSVGISGTQVSYLSYLTMAQVNPKTIVLNRDYSTTDGTQLVFSDPGSTWPSLIGATIQFQLYSNPGGSPVFTTTAAIIVNTGPNQMVTVDIPLAALAAANIISGMYSYLLLPTLASGHKAPTNLQEGLAYVSQSGF